MSTNAEIVRQKLGEEIKPGMSEGETGFTNDHIADLLERNGGDVTKAVAEGWQIKAARYADLVNTTEGTSKRNFSDLHQHALRMAQEFGEGSTGAKAVTRLHQIKRR